MKDTKLDFSQARFMHRNWQLRVRNFLDGKETITEEQAVSHHHCDLGKWYDAEGKAKYGHLDMMKKFDADHEMLHNLVKDIRALKVNGKTQEAEQKYKVLEQTSNNIVNALTRVEALVNV